MERGREGALARWGNSYYTSLIISVGTGRGGGCFGL